MSRRFRGSFLAVGIVICVAFLFLWMFSVAEENFKTRAEMIEECKQIPTSTYCRMLGTTP